MDITHILFIYDATIKCDELYSVSFRMCSSTRVFAQVSAIDQYVIYIICLYRHVNNYTFQYSLSWIRAVLADQQIGLMLARDLQYSYRDFAKDLLSSCNQNAKLADIPIQFKDPIYGSNDPSFTDFVAPGVILT